MRTIIHPCLLALALLVWPEHAPAANLPNGVRRVGRVAPDALTESSGVVASRRHAGVFWIHTDGGKKQALYAIDRTGSGLGRFPIKGVDIEDWEDIAIDDAGHVFIGDIGNNNARRSKLFVHRVAEPDPRGSRAITPDKSWTLRFADAPFDCEALFVRGPSGYVISKVFDDRRAQLWRFPLDGAREQTLELVCTLDITSPVTGADLSADGSRLGVVARAGAYVFAVDGNLACATGQRPYEVRLKEHHIEGCTFVPEGLLAVSEDRTIYLFTDAPFRAAAR